MQIELLIKVYLDSGSERVIVDLPDTGVFKKVTDGIHARIVPGQTVAVDSRTKAGRKSERFER